MVSGSKMGKICEHCTEFLLGAGRDVFCLAALGADQGDPHFTDSVIKTTDEAQTI
jgi:hypothetical protein